MNYKTFIAIVSTLAVCIVALTACSGKDVEVTTRGNNKITTSASPDINIPAVTTSGTLQTTAHTTIAPVTDAKPVETPNIAEDEKIVLNSADQNTGALIYVTEENPYNISDLLTPDEIDALSNEKIDELVLLLGKLMK